MSKIKDDINIANMNIWRDTTEIEDKLRIK